MPTQRNRRNTLYGLNVPLAGLQQEPIVSQRDPNTADGAEIGTIWCNTTSQSFFILCSSVAGVNTWTSTTGGATTLTSLTVNPGNIEVTAGEVIIDIGDLTMDPTSTANLGILRAGASTLSSTLDVTGAVTMGSTLEVTGDVTLNADLDVIGDVTVSGDFDITSAAALSFTTTSDTAPAISFTTNGGTSETMVFTVTQGTSAASLNLVSTVGGVTLQGGLATADAVNILSGATGGIDMDYGSAGMTITGNNGTFALASGSGAISISADAAATTVNIGTGAAVIKTISVGGTGANIIAIGNTQTAGSVSIGNAMTTGTVTIGGSGLQTGTISIAPGTGAQTVGIATGGTGVKTVNIATGAIGNIVTIGSATAAASLSLLSGTGNITAASTGTLLLDSVGVLELNSSAGIIGIGNDAVAQNINVGTGAAARTITVGNITGATSVVLNVGTGALNLGTSATAHTTNVGSTTAGATLVLNTPAGTNVAAANGLSVTTAGRGLSLPGGLLVLAGAGSPSGTVTAPIGSLFLRSDPAGATSRAYINTDAGTTWTNITCAG
jgi:hypothetical protein